MAKKLDPRELAVADQLRAEIAGSEWRKIAPFVRALNARGVAVDYTSFFNRVNGKSPLPTHILLSSLDMLGIDWVTFMTAAMKRMSR
jgi:hypothetical protein